MGNAAFGNVLNSALSAFDKGLLHDRNKLHEQYTSHVPQALTTQGLTLHAEHAVQGSACAA